MVTATKINPEIPAAMTSTTTEELKAVEALSKPAAKREFNFVYVMVFFRLHIFAGTCVYGHVPISMDTSNLTCLLMCTVPFLWHYLSLLTYIHLLWVNTVILAESLLKSFLSGGFGGVCIVLVGHPLDLVKVRSV